LEGCEELPLGLDILLQGLGSCREEGMWERRKDNTAYTQRSALLEIALLPWDRHRRVDSTAERQKMGAAALPCPALLP
jgi:hypothetical protein